MKCTFCEEKAEFEYETEKSLIFTCTKHKRAAFYGSVVMFSK